MCVCVFVARRIRFALVVVGGVVVAAAVDFVCPKSAIETGREYIARMRGDTRSC